MTASADIAQVETKVNLQSRTVPSFETYLKKNKLKKAKIETDKTNIEKAKEVKLDIIKALSEGDLGELRNKHPFRQVDIAEQNNKYYKIIDFYKEISESDILEAIGKQGVLGESVEIKGKRMIFLMSEMSEES